MALTGMQIYKLLPKTNCKKCDMPTCLAFAMKLASQKAEISQCPDASEECVQILGTSSEPPIVSIELKDIEREIGGETVLYRHDKKFFNPAIIAMKLSDELSQAEIAAKATKNWTLERVGQVMEPEAFYLENRSGDKEKLVSLAKTVAENCPGKLMMFQSDNLENLKEASSACASIGVKSPIFAFANRDNYLELSEIAKLSNGSIIVNGASINEIAEITSKLREREFKSVILSTNAGGGVRKDYDDNTVARRLALKKEVKELGFPVINFMTDINSEDDVYNVAFDASTSICKYASIIVLDDPDKIPVSLMTGLMILRQNIYTDPQKPIQMESKLYEIGEVNQETPLYVTTNFSLTYFLVAGEIEASNHPAYLGVIDTEGMGVLTAWAAGKLNGDVIKKFISDNGIEEKLSFKRIILPGYVAALSGEVEEELPEWDIIVGPQEAQDIPAFVKARLQ